MLLRDIDSSASTSREGQIAQGPPQLFYMPVDINNIKEETNYMEVPENQENADDDDDSYEGEHIASMLDVDFSAVSPPEPDHKKVIVIPKSMQMKYAQSVPYVKVQQPQHPDVLLKEELEFKINSNAFWVFSFLKGRRKL